MEVLNGILEHLPAVLEWRVVAAMAIGILAGIIAGALPGLTATMSMALLVPFTFAIQSNAEAVLLLLGIYIGTMHGGAISAILIRTPGTPAAACTVFDGYPLAQRGEAARALNISTVASTFGGLASALALIVFAPEVASLALRFYGLPMFLLAMFGLTVVTSVSEGSILKGLLNGVTGLLISTVGLHLGSGTMRFALPKPGLLSDPPPGVSLDAAYAPLINFGGRAALEEGIAFIPLMIGLFAVAETLMQVEEAARGRRFSWRRAPAATSGDAPDRAPATTHPARSLAARVMAAIGAALWRMARPISGADFRRILPSMSISSVIGTIVGAIPGTGGDIAGFVSYDATRRLSKNRAEFGKGAIEGVAASETANNAVTGGAMIPMVTMGIPGDAVTAILLGALRERGFQPGHDFLHPGPGKEATVTIAYVAFGGLLVANALAMPLRLLLTPWLSKTVTIARHFLWPAVAVFSLVGAYAMGQSMFPVDVMLIFGFFGYFMRRFGFPPGPLILGVILGPLAEEHLDKALALDPTLSGLYTDPLSITLAALILLSLLRPVFSRIGRALAGRTPPESAPRPPA
ncbi:MAG: tripartite tricarboxylate transporter permease [Planctomycetes bacterium]|nr:tripartite tricarboxylate transporter permease [Planctomycetota bacterium]